jgi:hypothetical protein
MWVSPGSFSIGCKKELEVILDTKTNVSQVTWRTTFKMEIPENVACIQIHISVWQFDWIIFDGVIALFKNRFT